MSSPRQRRPPAALPVALALALAAPARAAAPPPTEPAVVARVGEQEVTRDELREHLATLAPKELAGLAADPALLVQAVRGYLARRLVVQAAQANGWDRRPAVRAQLARVHEETLAELYLQAVSRPPDDYPSDAEVREAYLARPAAFEAPPRYRVAQVFVAVPAAGGPAEAAARRRLDEVLRRLQAEGADFAAVARELSEERGSAGQGGEIGWLAEAQLVPGLRATVAGLARGAISVPVRLEGGWHVLRLLDSRPAGPQPLAEVREALTARLRQERALANRRAYLARLLEQSPPEVDEPGLSTLLPPGP